MTEISTSFADTIGNLAKEFSKSTPAAALFYNKDGSGAGLRIESIELMKEFSNGLDFGRDPEGLLFYNEASDFKNITTGPVKFKTYYHSSDAKYVKIDFFYLSTDTSPFTTFLARDNVGLNKDYLKDGEGAWDDLKTGTCSTKIVKHTTDKAVNLTMESIGKKVTFEVHDNSGKKGIDTRGVFYFPSVAKLTGSECMTNYDFDRIIFYPKSDQSKMLAVFFPTDGGSMGIKETVYFPTATWSDI